MPARVVIVGGGITGLSAAYDLAKAGIPYTLVEKESRLGGVIQTKSWEGCLLEGGPDSFLSTKSEGLALIRELGLEDEVIGSNDSQRSTFLLRNGHLTPLPEGMTMFIPSRAIPLLKSKLFSWPAKLRMGAELLRRPESHPDRSVSEFVIDHFGEEMLEYLAEPLLSGVYGGDPEQMSINSVLPRFVEMERQKGSLARAMLGARKPALATDNKKLPFQTTLRGGLGKLTDKLSEGVEVRKGIAHSLERQGDGWRVKVGEDWIDASHVILACPAWAAAHLVEDTDLRLSELLHAIPYSSSLTLAMVYRASEFNGRRAGFGFLVPRKERDRLLGCTFVGNKFANRVPDDKITLRCFFGGMSDPAVLGESDEDLVAQAREELQRILGLTAAPIHASISRSPEAMAQYTDRACGAVERDRAAGIRPTRVISCGQCIHGHRHPGLHSDGAAGRAKNSNGYFMITRTIEGWTSIRSIE